MKAPLSWILEHVDVPAGTTTEHLTDRLTLTGLKLEAIVSPGRDITGPLVIGRVLTMEPEPQKNGKTINWCTVDVGDANGTGEPQGIVCGAHNFKPGDLVATVLPGGVLPGGFEIGARKTYGHMSAGMICSARELGLGDDHDGIIVLPADAGEPGQDVRPVLGLDEETIEFEINPDRAYALSIRGIAREVLVSVDGASDFRDPADRTTPAANADGHPVVVEDAEGCPVFVARKVTGFDPSATTPDHIVQRITAAGMRPISLAVDVTNYVMLETGRPIHGYDADKVQGALVVRRARDGERLRTLDGTDRVLDPADLVVTDDSGMIGLGGVMGGETTEMSGTTTSILVEAAHWDAVSMYRTGRRHKVTSEAGRRNERGVDPTICEAAADRVVELLVEHGGGQADPGVTVVGTPPAMPVVEVPGDLAERVSGMPITEERSVECLRAVGCEVSGNGTLTVTPPPWRPDLTDAQDFSEEVIRLVGYDRVPSILPTPPSGRGLTRSQQLRRRIGRTLAGDGFVEVVTFPFVGPNDLDDLRPPGRRRAARPAAPVEPAQRRGAVHDHDAVARRPARGRAQRRPRQCRPGDLRDRHRDAPAPLRSGRDPARGPSSDRRGVRGTRRGTAGELHLALVAAGDAVAGGWGPARPVTWADAIEAVRSVAAALGLRSTASPAELAPAPGPLRGAVRGRRGRGPRRRGAPDRLPGLRAAEAHRRGRGRPRPAHRAAVHLRPAPAFSSYPVAEDVALVVDASVPAADVESALREGAATCSSRSGSSTSTPATRSARQEVAGVRLAVPRSRPEPSRRVRPHRHATLPWHSPPSDRRGPARLTSPVHRCAGP